MRNLLLSRAHIGKLMKGRVRILKKSKKQNYCNHKCRDFKKLTAVALSKHLIPGTTLFRTDAILQMVLLALAQWNRL
jgi:hypothetical protein